MTPVSPMVKTEVNEAGELVRAWVPSKSQPATVYEMVRGWRHVGEGCEAFKNGVECYHIKAVALAEAVTS